MRVCKQKLDFELARACLSVADLRSEVSSATLSKIRNQPNYEATPKTVGKLARALNISVDALIEREATP